MRLGEGYAPPRQPVRDFGGQRESLARLPREPSTSDRSVRTIPVIAGSTTASESTASNAARLSSLRSRLYENGSAFSSVRIVVRSPMRRAARPRVSSAMSGFFFCGMIELPVANASSSSIQRKLLRAPEHELLGQPRQLDTDHRRDEDEFGNVIAAAHRVDRVLAGPVVAKLAADVRVHRDRRSGQRSAPSGERAWRRSQSMHDRHRAQTPAHAREVVREHDRLRRLQMREAGRERLDMPHRLRGSASCRSSTRDEGRAPGADRA